MWNECGGWSRSNEWWFSDVISSSCSLCASWELRACLVLLLMLEFSSWSWEIRKWFMCSTLHQDALPVHTTRCLQPYFVLVRRVSIRLLALLPPRNSSSGLLVLLNCLLLLDIVNWQQPSDRWSLLCQLYWCPLRYDFVCSWRISRRHLRSIGQKQLWLVILLLSNLEIYLLAGLCFSSFDEILDWAWDPLLKCLLYFLRAQTLEFLRKLRLWCILDDPLFDELLLGPHNSDEVFHFIWVPGSLVGFCSWLDCWQRHHLLQSCSYLLSYLLPSGSESFRLLLLFLERSNRLGLTSCHRLHLESQFTNPILRRRVSQSLLSIVAFLTISDHELDWLNRLKRELSRHSLWQALSHAPLSKYFRLLISLWWCDENITRLSEISMNFTCFRLFVFLVNWILQKWFRLSFWNRKELSRRQSEHALLVIWVFAWVVNMIFILAFCAQCARKMALMRSCQQQHLISLIKASLGFLHSAILFAFNLVFLGNRHRFPQLRNWEQVPWVLCL